MDAKSIEKKMGVLSALLGYLGSFVILVMMCLTTADVVGRYIFNAPILGLFELTEFMMLVIVFSFLAYSQSHKSHICVDLFFNFLPEKLKFYIDLFNHVVCLALMVLITWMGVEKALEMREVREISPNLGIPVYPFVFFVVLGCVVMCIEYIRDLIRLFVSKEST
jgi:TRAP-type C4-dicarboxylate transport system permease small subunit